jgi:hypothetical protein
LGEENQRGPGILEEVHIALLSRAIGLLDQEVLRNLRAKPEFIEKGGERKGGYRLERFTNHLSTRRSKT